jgi:preprotein translocase subunit SecG
MLTSLILAYLSGHSGSSSIMPKAAPKAPAQQPATQPAQANPASAPATAPTGNAGQTTPQPAKK